jgi:hypothetical protein
VRTNASSTTPTDYDPTVATGGHNRFSIRAGYGTAGTAALDGSAVNVYAGGRLPMYANGTSGTPIFYLARVMPYDAGRTVRISLFDIGDAGNASDSTTWGTLQILPPVENGNTIGGCTFQRWSGTDPATDTSASLTKNGATCTLTNVQSNQGYQGSLETIDVKLPDNYTCDTTTDTGCWFRIKEAFPQGVDDTTTWTVAVLGNPVRLVK